MNFRMLNKMVKEGLKAIDDGASSHWVSGTIELNGKIYFINIAVKRMK